MMDTFGEKLRSVREDRGLTIESASAATGVEVERLQALEANACDSLPGEESVLAALRAYAEYLSVDADLMIEDYRCERQKAVPPFETPTDPVAASREPDPPSAQHTLARGATRLSRLPLWPVALGGLALAILGVWWFRPETPVARDPQTFDPNVTIETRDGVPETTPAVATLDAPLKRSVESGARRANDPVEVTSSDRDPLPATSARPADPSAANIPDYGVGTGVDNRQLLGESSRFREGTQVWFWTRVEGAERGDRIHHVWLYDGVEAARVKLRVGGASWRTHSAKTLWPGSVGDWVVEARDEQGRVLARQPFVCAP